MPCHRFGGEVANGLSFGRQCIDCIGSCMHEKIKMSDILLPISFAHKYIYFLMYLSIYLHLDEM